MRVRWGLVAAVTGIVMLVSAACAAAGPTPSPTSVFPNVVGILDATGPGWHMAKAGGALWIQVDPPVNGIVRIDVATGEAKLAVPEGARVSSGPDGLWAACCEGLARVDPATSEILVNVPGSGEFGAFAVASGGVWVLSAAGIQPVDPVSGAVGESAGPFDESLCAEGAYFETGFGSGWLACKEGHVVRIDIATGSATIIPTAAGSHTFTVTDDAVWVSNYQDPSVSRIDPATNSVTTIKGNGAGSGIGITSGGGFIWASSGSGIVQIDPVSATIVRSFEIGSGWFYELVWDDGIIWSSTSLNDVLKIDPYR